MQKILLFLRGMLMGLADTIPGVSGGTIAMIVGIYERLVTAISHFDVTFLQLLFAGRLRDAWKHADVGFVLNLLLGIITGILLFSVLVLHLLENHLPPTFAAFFGLILGSVWILYKEMESRKPSTFLAIAIGAAAAWFIVGLDSIQGSEALPYVFGCGLVAICAMILPGISGSYILLILGEYAIILGKIRKIVHLEAGVQDYLTLAVFASGCVIGLVGFSKLLKWLLARYHTLTLAVLCGFMLGSLRCLYPLQKMVVDGDSRHFEMIPFAQTTPALGAAVALAFLGGLVFILVLYRLGKVREK